MRLAAVNAASKLITVEQLVLLMFGETIPLADADVLPWAIALKASIGIPKVVTANAYPNVALQITFTISKVVNVSATKNAVIMSISMKKPANVSLSAYHLSLVQKDRNGNSTLASVNAFQLILRAMDCKAGTLTLANASVKQILTAVEVSKLIQVLVDASGWA